MALRSPHGAAVERGLPGPRVEVLPPDELPAPVSDPLQVDPSAQVRDHGRFVRGQAGPIQAMGGRARRGRPSLVSSLGLTTGIEPSADAFLSYRRKAASFRRAHCTELAALAGGVCGTGPSSFVATAALQLAVSRYLYDKATAGPGEPSVLLLKEARQQGDSSRQNLLAAYELAVREAQRRGKRDVDPLTVIEAKQRAAAKEAGLSHEADGL